MKFIILDKPIQDQKLVTTLKTKNYSEIYFKNQTLLERLKNSLDDRFEFSYSKDEESLIRDDECIIWSSDIVYKDLRNQRLFLDKLFFSYGPYLWGNKKSFIFKGSYSDLVNYSAQTGNLEDFLFLINSFETFQSLLDENLNTRFFNQIHKVSEKYIKKSKDVNKLKKEYEFLQCIPDDIKKYYISADSFESNLEEAQYVMPKINFLDISKRHINGLLSKKDIDNLFNELTKYMDLVINLSFIKEGNEFNFIYEKTVERIDEFRKLEVFIELDTFIKNHTNFSGLEEVFENLLNLLSLKKGLIKDKGSIFSHGDLCFSNILASDTFDRLVFVDPRGGSYKESMRSIYYDFAKLSHSIMGNYDKIINNVAEIKFNNSMEAYISYKTEDNKYLSQKFKNFISLYKLDISLVRLIEASLFLSMLPLHSEDTRKMIMLALRGTEILREFD
jgi:hypothetical protein